MGGSGPTNAIFAHTLFKKDARDIFFNPNGKTTWLGNMYQGTLGISIASGMIAIDPKFALSARVFIKLDRLAVQLMLRARSILVFLI